MFRHGRMRGVPPLPADGRRTAGNVGEHYQLCCHRCAFRFHQYQSVHAYDIWLLPAESDHRHHQLCDCGDYVRGHVRDSSDRQRNRILEDHCSDMLLYYFGAGGGDALSFHLSFHISHPLSQRRRDHVKIQGILPDLFRHDIRSFAGICKQVGGHRVGDNLLDQGAVRDAIDDGDNSRSHSVIE